MILKTCLLLIVSVAWEVYGVSYSNVFVQNGPETIPSVDYMQYGVPSYNYEFTSPQATQLKAVPYRYEYPFGQSYNYRTTYPEPTIANIAPAAPSANIITYSAPVANTPYLYGSEPASSYSYVLVNSGAGQDLKLSDGEVIRGGYTLVQPEGLVQYVADDNQGFNAIVKNYIPNDAVTQTETVRHETVRHETVHHAEPCHEAKSEALTAHESHEEEHEEHHGGQDHQESEEHEEEHEAHHKSHEVHHESLEAHHESHEARHGSHESHEEAEVNEFVVHGSGSHESGSHEHIIVIHEKEEPEVESEEHHETDHKGHSHHESGHESHEEREEEATHESHESHESHENHEPHHTHEAIVEASHEPHEIHGHEGHVPAIQVPALVGNNVYIPYNDLIKCIQAAIAKGNTHPYFAPAAKPTSPLTYLIFNKPC